MRTVLSSISISFLIYLGIACILIAINGKDRIADLNSNKIDFNNLIIDYANIPEILRYRARDNTELTFRYYPSNSNIVLILLHGSGWHSRYFYLLAENISANNLAHIYTPDLRGHGEDPESRGDINYINQLEDDINDFIKYIRDRHPDSRIILGGHSSGGGLAIRYAGSQYRNDIDAYLLLSPYLNYNAPTMISNSGGWTSVHMPRIIGLSMLNNVGIRFLNNLSIIDFNMPEEYRDGTETLSYSYRLNTGFAPRDYKKDLSSINQELLIIVGSNDESFRANMFYPEVSKYKKDVKVKIINNVNHMGVVTNKKAWSAISTWLKDYN